MRPALEFVAPPRSSLRRIAVQPPRCAPTTRRLSRFRTTQRLRRSASFFEWSRRSDAIHPPGIAPLLDTRLVESGTSNARARSVPPPRSGPALPPPETADPGSSCPQRFASGSQTHLIAGWQNVRHGQPLPVRPVAVQPLPARHADGPPLLRGHRADPADVTDARARRGPCRAPTPHDRARRGSAGDLPRLRRPGVGLHRTRGRPRPHRRQPVPGRDRPRRKRHRRCGDASPAPSTTAGDPIVDVATRVSPAVVTITAQGVSSSFGPFNMPATGVGSGVIVRADGWTSPTRTWWRARRP